MPNVESDLNEIITAAVQARVEAAVTEALAGGEVFGQYVQAALTRQITVKDGYRDRKTTFMHETITGAIKAATEAAVRKVILEETPAIEAAVRQELQSNLADVAVTLTDSLVRSAKNTYGIQVRLKVPGED